MEMSKKTKLVKQKKQPNGTVQSVKLMFILMNPQFAMDVQSGTILNVLASKRHQNPRTGYADSAITKESNLIISYVIPSL